MMVYVPEYNYFQWVNLQMLSQQQLQVAAIYNNQLQQAFIEEQRIAKAKSEYPAWFEPAREWDKIP